MRFILIFTLGSAFANSISGWPNELSLPDSVQTGYQLLLELNNSGYPFAKVQKDKSNWIVTSGEKWFIKDLILKPKPPLDAWLVYKELDLSPNEIWSEKWVHIKNWNSLPIKSKGQPILFRDSLRNLIRVQYPVESTSKSSLGVNFFSSGSSDWGGVLEAKFPNWNKSLGYVGFSFIKQNQKADIKGDWKHSYWFKSWFSTKVFGHFMTEDTLFRESKFKASAGFENAQFSLLYGLEYATLDSMKYQENVWQLVEGFIKSIDFIANTNVFGTLLWKGHTKRTFLSLNFEPENSIYRSSIKMGRFWPYTSEYPDQFWFLGGSNSYRGFLPNAIRSSAFISMQNELSWDFNLINVFTFFDLLSYSEKAEYFSGEYTLAPGFGILAKKSNWKIQIDFSPKINWDHSLIFVKLIHLL